MFGKTLKKLNPLSQTLAKNILGDGHLYNQYFINKINALPAESGDFIIDLGFFSNPQVEEKYYALVLNRWYSFLSHLNYEFKNPNSDHNNYILTNVNTGQRYNLNLSIHHNLQSSLPKGDAHLFELSPSVKYGGQIQTNETINQNTILEDNLTITADDTLYINAVYTVRDTIFVNTGGFIKINHGGVIEFENDGALVYENWSDCLVINQNTSHPKLIWQKYGTGNRYKIYRQKDNPYFQLIATIQSDTIKTYEDINTIIAFGTPQMNETIANYYIVVQEFRKNNWFSRDTTNIADVTRAVANIEKAAVKPENVITEYNLLQNYPNPFNPETHIHYQLAADSRVLLTIYDILGNEVAVLVDEVKPAGKYEIRFDASHLSSGMYLYKLTVGNYTKVQKMLLLK